MSAVELIIITACLLGSWFFSGIETGLISINRLRLRHLVRHKVPGADTLQRLLQNPDRLLGTTLVGNNIVNTVLSVMATSIGVRWMGAKGATIAGITVTLLILVLCEYFPKAWFQSFPARRCLPFAPALEIAEMLLYPIGRLLMGLIKLFIPQPKPESSSAQPFITREELIHLAHEGQKSGALTPEELRMINGVFELKLMTCEEIMIPLDKVIYVHNDTTADDLQLFARNQKVQQFPVMDKDRRTFIGVVYIFDVLSDENPRGKTARDYMRPPQMVERSTPVDHVLPRMRVTQQPLVMVADEQGKIIGIVTLDDVLEEVVGSL